MSVAAEASSAGTCKLGDIATIWRGGCIIRARFLDRIKEPMTAIRTRRTCCWTTISATPS